MDEDVLVLPVVRLQADEANGFAPEPVTCKRFRVLQYEYCAWTLASLWLNGKLGFVDFKLPELDDMPRACTALCPTFAKHDLKELANGMCVGRIEQRSVRDQEIGYGYDIPPSGPIETFGYDCPSVAGWMIINRMAPALVFRRNDDTEELYHKWLEGWARTLSVRKDWPVTAEHTDLLVPNHFQRTSLTRVPRRNRSQVRRFIGL